MSKFFSAFLAAFFAMFLTGCIQNDTAVDEIEDYQTDNTSYYMELEDEDYIPDEDVEEEIWDVKFSFSGTINDGNAENIVNGSGLLTYIDDENMPFTINSAWAIKKDITLNSGKKVPMIQVFFADNHVDDNGQRVYFVLQLEGSSVSSRSETHYLNNDKIYEARVKINDETGKVKEICYIREPNPTKGIVHIFTNNIRIGEELRVDGYADMLDMEIKECKKMN